MTEALPVTDISLAEIEAAGAGQRRLRRPAAARRRGAAEPAATDGRGGRRADRPSRR